MSHKSFFFSFCFALLMLSWKTAGWIWAFPRSAHNDNISRLYSLPSYSPIKSNSGFPITVIRDPDPILKHFFDIEFSIRFFCILTL